MKTKGYLPRRSPHFFFERNAKRNREAIEAPKKKQKEKTKNKYKEKQNRTLSPVLFFCPECVFFVPFVCFCPVCFFFSPNDLLLILSRLRFFVPEASKGGFQGRLPREASKGGFQGRLPKEREEWEAFEGSFKGRSGSFEGGFKGGLRSPLQSPFRPHEGLAKPALRAPFIHHEGSAKPPLTHPSSPRRSDEALPSTLQSFTLPPCSPPSLPFEAPSTPLKPLPASHLRSPCEGTS